jgi:cytochrome c biogenesis protein CcmG/thiol:disulfide interchange protein DsbE
MSSADLGTSRADNDGQEAPARAGVRGARILLQLAAVGVVLALLALLAWKLVAGSPGSGFVERIKRGEKPPAPAFALPVIWPHDETWPTALKPKLADGRLSLAELRGYPVVVNFWASWCLPCKDEAPELAAAARAHAGKVAFVGIDVQDFTSDARRFLRKVKAPYVAVPRTYTAYGLTGVPETYYLDARGRAVAHDVGAVTADELEAGLAKARS